MRTFIFSVIFSVVVLFGVELSAPVVANACDHYYEIVVIGDQQYRIEYDCDGGIVSIVPVYD